MLRILRRLAFTLIALTLAAAPAFAQADDRCIGPIAAASPLLQRVALRAAANEAGATRLTFIGHATFLIESPGGVTIATDYNDYVRPQTTPLIATMNRAHDTHYTLRPDPAIKHVLRGWAEPGQPADHDLRVGDARIRNVATNIRDGYGATQYYGNSIFVFQIGDLCIAHLGHLHHTLTPKHLEALGHIDVVLAPVDGSFTLNVDGMMDVIKQTNARLIIPMHYFGASTLQRFLDKARERAWDVERSDVSSVAVSQATLPQTPKVLVLPGR
ncbi:MAG: hypothetical protein BGP06_00550 [Rhizobiales bacterium 65-9]|nr:MBL fold metallo-hydrolase [Hyphomicrobiales bacterium]OJY37401.1 MAG: hypothetical protein BGP06_00550 [Rhizobiales bacterium 65-9]